jgi:two-component system response regulator DctR
VTPRGAAAQDWRVLVVEDDVAVASLHRQVVDDTPNFQTVATAVNGELAYDAIRTLEPDLAIVDLTMPGGDGTALLRRIRLEGLPLDAVVVTASRDASTIRTIMHLGVLDYLVKPFAPDRLRQSLTSFALRSRTLRRNLLMQDDVDLVQWSGAPRLQRLPKGLKRSTLATVRGVLECSDRALTAEEVGERAGIARVTARRYLDYLDVVGAARVERECRGPGRPPNRYRRAGTAVAP